MRAECKEAGVDHTLAFPPGDTAGWDVQRSSLHRVTLDLKGDALPDCWAQADPVVLLPIQLPVHGLRAQLSWKGPRMADQGEEFNPPKKAGAMVGRDYWFNKGKGPSRTQQEEEAEEDHGRAEPSDHPPASIHPLHAKYLMNMHEGAWLREPHSQKRLAHTSWVP